MRRIGERQPNFFRRVAQFSRENERPLLSALSHLRAAGRARFVSLAIGHILSQPALLYQRISCVTWMRLPQVSLSMAIFDAVTAFGGTVNSAPCAFMRS